MEQNRVKQSVLVSMSLTLFGLILGLLKNGVFWISKEGMGLSFLSSFLDQYFSNTKIEYFGDHWRPKNKEENREHWSKKKVIRPGVPTVSAFE